MIYNEKLLGLKIEWESTRWDDHKHVHLKLIGSGIIHAVSSHDKSFTFLVLNDKIYWGNEELLDEPFITITSKTVKKIHSRQNLEEIKVSRAELLDMEE